MDSPWKLPISSEIFLPGRVHPWLITGWCLSSESQMILTSSSRSQWVPHKAHIVWLYISGHFQLGKWGTVPPVIWKIGTDSPWNTIRPASSLGNWPIGWLSPSIPSIFDEDFPSLPYFFNSKTSSQKEFNCSIYSVSSLGTPIYLYRASLRWASHPPPLDDIQRLAQDSLGAFHGIIVARGGSDPTEETTIKKQKGP